MSRTPADGIDGQLGLECHAVASPPQPSNSAPFPNAQMMPPRRHLRVGGTSGSARIYLSNQMELAKHHTPTSALSGCREEGREGRGGAQMADNPPPG